MSAELPNVTLSLTGEQHERLKAFLFPGDGKEAAAIALCGRRSGERRHRLLVREIHEIPYDVCSRSPIGVSWPTDIIAPLLDKAEREGLSVVKFHSHPSGYSLFSKTDDEGDGRLMPAIRGWIEADIPHASVVMLPDGAMFGRVLWRSHIFMPLTTIAVAGPDLRFWWHGKGDAYLAAGFTASHKQAFGAGTTELLGRLSVAVIGCSGTGSPLIEQLVRLGVGELILIDDDRVEERNINRILNSTLEDAESRRFKVDVLAEAIDKIGLGTRVRTYNRNLDDSEVILAVAESDIIFGCMDTIAGRFWLNLIATFYTLPYFDLGVRLEAVPQGIEKGRIREVCGTVHYLQPGLSSLMSRGLVKMEDVAAEILYRDDPNAHAQQVKDGYIRGIKEGRPAVISVNMFIAALAVNDLLARLHPYREQMNSDIASVEFSLSSLEIFTDKEDESCSILRSYVGQGDAEPLLLQTRFSMRAAA